jgi:antitoxin VapB
MPLNIKNPEAHALAARLAKLTGETLTEAVTAALRERLARIENVSAIDDERYRELKALVEGSRKLWREPYLAKDHGELLYDELGLPKRLSTHRLSSLSSRRSRRRGASCMS